MYHSPAFATAFRWFQSLSARNQLIVAVWALFLLLVGLGIHGSSIGFTAKWWSPEAPYKGFLFKVPDRLREPSAPVFGEGLGGYLMAHAEMIRWDEFGISTPWALSQLSHKPRFPVINKNIGNGQNMLVVPHTPVLHVATLARPATWGYFLFGARRGLAWSWWFQVFACFTVLLLLFEIILEGNWRLAAFGAFWFCGSAYVVCWSQWPAYTTFFAALICLTAYYLLSSQSKRTLVVSAILFGLGIPGFIMLLYPPWQVTLAHFGLFLFIGLIVRDKLYISARSILRFRLLCIGGAVLLATGLALAWLKTCLPDLRVMAATVYPGHRVSYGGDYLFGLMFKGMYNLSTIYNTPPSLRNQSEAASFFYLFPAAIAGMLISRRFARKIGVVGWILTGYIFAMTIFLLAGVPQTIARLTLLTCVPTYRADLSIGLASIVLCLIAIAAARTLRKESETGWQRLAPWVGSGMVVLFFIIHSLFLMKLTGPFPEPSEALFVSLTAGFASYALLTGWTKGFTAIVATAVVATSAFFNPLATSLDHLYNSELAREIKWIDDQSGDQRPLWICYGGIHPGMLVTVLGCRSLSGVQWPPQLAMWQALDRDGHNETVYNRYAEVSLEYTPQKKKVSFANHQEGALTVWVSPLNPVLRSMGARYVLLLGDAQSSVDTSKLDLIYRSASGSFSIYDIHNDAFAVGTATR
jgi:hypothetical protein